MAGGQAESIDGGALHLALGALTVISKTQDEGQATVASTDVIPQRKLISFCLDFRAQRIGFPPVTCILTTIHDVQRYTSPHSALSTALTRLARARTLSRRLQNRPASSKTLAVQHG